MVRLRPRADERSGKDAPRAPRSSLGRLHDSATDVVEMGTGMRMRIEGLLPEEELDRLVAVDETIRALRLQLPTILNKPLTPPVAEKAYSRDGFCFSVLVVDDDDESSNAARSGDNESESSSEDGSNRDEDGARTRNENDIVILNSREELIALSDVLVLTTAVAQQAILVTGATIDTKVTIECQLIVDETCRAIRIPWRAKTPALTLGGGSSSALAAGSNSKRFNNFEGITDCYLSQKESVANTGKVERFVVRKATFNGRTLNGPAIGQALKSIQSTVTNLQQNPLLQNIAATAVSARLLPDDPTVSDSGASSSDPASAVPLYQVKSIYNLPLNIDDAWMDDESLKKFLANETVGNSNVPCPGTKDWDEYIESSSCLRRFSNKVIPQLSDLNIVDSGLFAEDVSLKMEEDDSVLMEGRESLANFFQSMALTRKGTGISWEMNRCRVIDWKNRTVAVSYEVKTKSFPLWKIQGRDIYVLDTSKDSPVIREIRQGNLIAKGPNGNEIRLDGRWLVENLATALQVEGMSSGTSIPRDFLTELLMNQPSLSPLLLKQQKSSGRTSSKRKLSEPAAAASYYTMVDLYEQGLSLFDPTSTSSPPVVEHMSENVELRGYLGESIIRGLPLYKRSIGSVLLGIRESIRQKRLLLEDTSVPPRIELLVPTGDIRATLTFLFRIPPPGAGIIPSPDISVGPVSGLPLKVELTSDYRIDPDTGSIVEHRLVETRINGQLTAGDQVSRWMQRFLNLDGAETAKDPVRSEDGALKAISDALSWFRSMR
eukprot:jgi/Psemu1/288974/fgenesh1_pg.305_\